jgi:6-phosphogluconolactonase
MIIQGQQHHKISYFDTLEDASRSIAALIIQKAEQAISARGQFSLALSGGTSPKQLYHLLSTPPVRQQIDWSHTLLFWGDERCVPPDHPQSNYNMTRKTMLDELDLDSKQVFRMRGELGPEEGARYYEEQLKKIFVSSQQTPPAMDCILLGLGTDGHTASIFPGADVLSEKVRWVVNVPPPETSEPFVPRLTFTLPLINRARQIIVLAGGDIKREIIEQIVAGEGSAYPAARLQNEGELLWCIY